MTPSRSPLRHECRTVPMGGRTGADCRVPAIALLVALLFAAAADAQTPPPTWRVGLSSTGYISEIESPSGETDSRFLGTHVFSGSASGLAGGYLAVRGSGRLANEPVAAPYGFETSKLYSGYLEVRPTTALKARLGRQLVTGGIGYQTLDGAWASWNMNPRATVEAWGGARTPFGHALDMDSLIDDASTGCRVTWRPNRRLRAAVAGAQDKRDARTERRRFGLELGGKPYRSVSAYTRFVYDQKNEYWDRLQGQVRWRPRGGLTTLTLQAVDRRPFIDPASYFARFADVQRVRVVRAALRMEKETGLGAELDAFGSFIDDRSASRIGAAVLLPGARVGYSVRLGDAGEENRFFGEVARQLKPWLWAGCEATFQTYALLTDAPASAERDLTTLSARVRARLRQGVRLTAEIQSLDNPDYSRDIRFLCGIDLTRSGRIDEHGEVQR